MADELGVMDAPEAETGAEEVESSAEAVEAGAEQVSEGEGAGKESTTDPYSTQFSREMRAALKSWEQANPEAAKYAKQARDNHARLFSLNQIEPKGIDGVREKYALLDGLTHGDYKGSEALTAIQEELAGVEEVDNLLAAGDPRAFDALGEDFDEGLAKLAPAYLERIQQSNPEAFQAAILPHLVNTLRNSEMLKDYNALVDVLMTQNDPRFDEKTKMQFVFTQLGKIGKWLNGLEASASSIKPAAAGGDKETSIEEERSQIEQERQNIHWDTKIKPQLATHENKKFDELFAPYQKRLKLDTAAKDDLQRAFKAGLNRAGTADNEYQRQIKIYRGQRNPNPATVSNYVKAAINKHSKPVMESLIKARYSPFLAGKPKTVTPVAAPTNGAKAKPIQANVEIRTVKPPSSEIDFKNTPVEWLREKKYRLNSGKIIQLRPA